jgi:two-component system LytT family sensor kinase
MRFYSTILFLMFSVVFGFAQNTGDYTVRSAQNSYKSFTLNGEIYEEDRTPVEDVEIQVNGGMYTKTNALGEFRLQVKKGDKITITSDYFDTIFYTVDTDDRLTVKVSEGRYNNSSKIFKDNINAFEIALDSALYYKSISIEKSIQFITESIKKSTSVKQNAEAFELLGDVYTEWKQFDLAITNYKISLNNKEVIDVQLKLASAYSNNNSTENALKIYNQLTEVNLNNYQSIVVNEGIADVYFKTSKIKEALNLYKQGLKRAEEFKIQEKITDLNSKIGDVYAKMGAKDVAKSYYNKSLGLAGQQNETREIEEKEKVANFENTTQDYTKEIEIRKSVVETVENKKKSFYLPNESALTPQKQNYKIGNAYYLQKNYTEAVPYLEKSIQQADETEDLIVKKDATKKLSEVYSASKNYNKALETYKDYTSLVEELYRKKEQEISQAARFAKNLAEKQNRIQSLETDRQLSISQINLSKERNKRQQFYIYALIGGLFLVLLLAYLMFKYIKQQRLANNLLALKSLRSQMNPHFIFNALNSVNSFIAVNDERTANKYLSDFSKLMRAVLENSEEDFISLEKEIDLIKLYTQLEHFRFQDKFDYNIYIDENIQVSEFQIPPMLLQPYIENAVWHGLRYKTEKGYLNIRLEEAGRNNLKITITDNGIGREESKALKTNHQKKHNSKGLGNIQKRVDILNDMYKNKITVKVENNPTETGTQVVVLIKK